MNLKIYFGTFILFLITSIGYSATPTLDGAFDGLAVWGAPYASSDGSPGWASAIAGDLYSTNDDDYVYFAVTLTADIWMNWAFIVNTIDGQGGTADSWSRTISYTHAEAPDFTFRGTFTGYAEYHSWNGASWDGIGSAVEGTEYVATPGYIELRIPKADIGNVDEADVQFYITGDQNAHGSFDAVPDDINVTEWNPPAPTPLSNYQENIILPIELGDFKVKRFKNDVVINWSTLSEIDNDYFQIERSADLTVWSTIARIEGSENSSTKLTYELIDKQAPKTQVYYRIVQMDINGASRTYAPIRVSSSSNATEVFPNPMQDKLTIQFSDKLNSNSQLTLYNMNGSILKRKILEKGILSYQLDTNEIEAGIYFVVVEGPGINYTKKIVK